VLNGGTIAPGLPSRSITFFVISCPPKITMRLSTTTERFLLELTDAIAVGAAASGAGAEAPRPKRARAQKSATTPSKKAQKAKE